MNVTRPFLILAVACAATLDAQPAPDTLRALVSAHDHVRALGAGADPLWPGFRPDTIPVVLVLPGRGTALLNWGAPLPEGWRPTPGVSGAGWRDEVAMGATNTSIRLNGRPAAQAVVPTLSPEVLASLAAHEAFHVFQRASARPERRFGASENTIWLTQYPVFDVDNETAFALEGRLLAAALRARTVAEWRARAREFVAVREARHARLPMHIAEFDRMSELNEGLAEYVQLRVLERLSREGDPRTRDDAARERAARIARVERLAEDVQQSIRLRYYASGSAIALLLDRLEDATWKERLVRDDLTLQDALAFASGARDAAIAARASASRQFDESGLARAAKARVEQLAARRRARVDSVLSAPGLTIVLDVASVAPLQPCGFDPQNLLRVDAVTELHTRWLKACGAGVTAEFETQVVHDEAARRYTAVVADSAALTLTVAGDRRQLGDGDTIAAADDVVVAAPHLALRLKRAELLRQGRTLRVRPLP